MVIAEKADWPDHCGRSARAVKKMSSRPSSWGSSNRRASSSIETLLRSDRGGAGTLSGGPIAQVSNQILCLAQEKGLTITTPDAR